MRLRISTRATILALMLVALPFSFTVSSESTETSGQILWLRIPGDGTMHYISSDGSLKIHDQYDGSPLSEVEIAGFSEIMSEDLPVWGGYVYQYDWGHIDGWEDDECGGSCPSIIINGDYSSSGNSLYLNICKVDRHDNTVDGSESGLASRAILLLCEFIDFDSDYNVTRYSKSVTDYAVTYPTANGTFRVYSNHTIEDPESGHFGTISPKFSSGPSGEMNSILPYPLSDGETWMTSSYCIGKQAEQRFHQLSRSNSSLIFSEAGAYRIDDECNELFPRPFVGGGYSRETSIIFAGNGCWMRTPNLSDIFRWSIYERDSALDFPMDVMPSIPVSWFHIRLPRSSTPYQDIPNDQWVHLPSTHFPNTGGETLWTDSERLSGPQYESRACSVQYGLASYDQDATFGATNQRLGYYYSYDIDYESGVVYNVGCDWSVRHNARDLGIGCREIYTHPDDVENLSWASEIDSSFSQLLHNSGIDPDIFLVLLAILIFSFAMLADHKERTRNFNETGIRESNDERKKRERKLRERERERRERERERTQNFKETGIRETDKEKEFRVRRKKNSEKWKAREPKLRAIAEKVFSDIESFTIDLDDGHGCLHITDDDDNDFLYSNVLSRTFKSIKKEMKEDRDRKRDFSYSQSYSQRPGLLDYADALTRIRCTHCDQPTEGGPYKGTYLCADCGFLFDSMGNTI